MNKCFYIRPILMLAVGIYTLETEEIVDFLTENRPLTRDEIVQELRKQLPCLKEKRVKQLIKALPYALQREQEVGREPQALDSAISLITMMCGKEHQLVPMKIKQLSVAEVFFNSMNYT